MPRTVPNGRSPPRWLISALAAWPTPNASTEASAKPSRRTPAFHLLGVVAHQLRRSDAASLLGRAVALDPGLAEAHNDRGVILATSGLIPDALACFERAVALAPGYVEARNNLPGDCARWAFR